MTLTRVDNSDHRCRDPYALHQMFRLRHRVFRDRLGWSVPSVQGLERDDYDALNPVYLLARGPNREVTGCLRLLPTTQAYMLRDTFPEFLAGETAPADPRIWDISRLAVEHPDTGGSRPTIGAITVELVVGFLDYGLERGIDWYVAVVSVALERILRRMGLAMHRFGDEQARVIGDTRAVAVWIRVDRQGRDVVAARQGARGVA